MFSTLIGRVQTARPRAGRSPIPRGPAPPNAYSEHAQNRSGITRPLREGLLLFRHESSRPIRRLRHAAAPDHAHLGQAAGPGGEQAGAVLRPRGDRRRPAITDVGIVVGDTAPAIEAAVGDGSTFGIKVTYIRQQAPLGLAHAVLIARDFLGDDDFVMYLGDNFIVGGITALVEEFTAARPDAQIMLTRVSDPRSVRRRRARRRTGRVDRAWRRSRSSPRATWPWSASTCSPRPSTRRSPSLKPSWRGELEITEAIQWLIDNGRTVELDDDHRVLEGHRQRRRHARGEPAGARGASSRGSTAPSTTDCEIIGRVVDRGGRHVSGLAHRRPGDHRRGQPDHRLLHRPVHGDRRGLRGRATARSSTRSCCRARRSAASAGSRPRSSATTRRSRPRPGCRGRTGWCSATTVRCRSAHEDPGHRRRRASSARTTSARCCPAATRATRTPRSPCSTSSPTRATWPTSTRSQDSPATRSCTATSATPASWPRCCPATTRSCTSPPSRTSTGRSPAPRTSSAPTWSARRCCSTRCRDAGVGRFVHVSTDEVYGSIAEGSWTERLAARPELPVLGVQGRRRPDRPAPTPAPTGSTCRSPAAPTTTGRTSSRRRSSRCSSPTCSTASRCRCTATALNVRDWLHVDDHCRGIQLVLEQGAAGRGLQHRRRHRADQPRADRAPARRPAAPSWDDGGARRRPQGPRPPLLPRRLADPPMGYAPRMPFDDGLKATVALVRRQPRLVGAARTGPRRRPPRTRRRRKRVMTRWLVTGAAGCSAAT